MAELQLYADGDFDDDKENLVEFFYGPKMQCPVDDCDGISFVSKQNYQRHWDYRHLPTIVTYHCSFTNCSATCTRKSDMKAHLKRIHHLIDYPLDNKDSPVMRSLDRCSRVEVPNERYLDPGFFRYWGRSKPRSSSSSTVSSTAPSTSRSLVSCSDVPTPAATPMPSPPTTPPSSPTFTIQIPPKMPSPSAVPRMPLLPLPTVPVIVPDATPFTATSRISVEEYRSRPKTKSSNAPDGHTVTPSSNAPDGHTVTPSSNASAGHQTPFVNATIGYSVSLPVLTHSDVDFLSVPVENRRVLLSTPVSSASSVPLSDVHMETTSSQPVCVISSSSNTRIESSSQTSSFHLPPLFLPAIPTSQPELEAYLRWLCNSMDQLGRVRESAKRILEDIKDVAKNQERLRIRNIELENSELRRRLAEMKYREDLFNTGTNLLDL